MQAKEKEETADGLRNVPLDVVLGGGGKQINRRIRIGPKGLIHPFASVPSMSHTNNKPQAGAGIVPNSGPWTLGPLTLVRLPRGPGAEARIIRPRIASNSLFLARIDARS